MIKRLFLPLMLLLPLPAVADCGGRAEKKVRFSNNAVADTFVVESFGKTCTDAKVLIYVTTAEQGWHALYVNELGNVADVEVSPPNLKKALADIAARIEGVGRTPLESYDSIGKARGDAPPRVTPLVKTEYERLHKARPRAVIVPTDPARGLMFVWDSGTELQRPVPLIYYGD
jgi:hypothetical protein